MSEMQKILSGIKTEHLLAELEAHPELWNQYDFRTNYEGSAHKDVSDIVLRYRDFAEFDPDQPQKFSYQHTSEWYAAASHLPNIKSTVENIFTLVGGDELGGVLITRIPAVCSVLPHSDDGHWHSTYFLNKYLLLLESDPLQTFEFPVEDGEDEVHTGVAGDLFLFDNRNIHAVYNKSGKDRISLIMAIKKD